MENTFKVKHSFAVGAIIITVGMLAVKIFGAIFKIPLMSMLGGEGSGYFTGAYNLYNPIYALSTAGLPIAISKLVSESIAMGRFKDVRKIQKISAPMFMITGVIGFVLIIFGAFLYSKLSKSPGSLYSVFMLAPTLFFSCLTSTYRGYYEGLRNMTPTAVSEVVESLGKVVFGLSLTYFVNWYALNEFNLTGSVWGKIFGSEQELRAYILPFASAAAILGIAISAALGFIYIYVRHKIKGDAITISQLNSSLPARPGKQILKSLLSISTPVALGAIVMNAAGVVDSILIQRRLADIVSKNLPRLLGVYGSLLPQNTIDRGVTHIFLAGCFGYTSTIIMLLPTVAQGVAISTLPTMTAAWVSDSKKGIQKNIEKIIKLTAIVSIPMGVGLSVLAYPIMDLIYNTFGSGTQPGEIYIGASIMAIAGIGAVFTSLSTPICSMLQAIGRADLPVKILSVGVVIKVILNYILVGIPEINIQGAGVGTLVCYIFVFSCALWQLCKNAKVRVDPLIFLKPAISALICAFSAYASLGLFIKMSINYKFSTVLSIIISCLIYVIALFVTHAVDYEDIRTLPKGENLARTLKKLGLI
ncbi:MAG: polysaccharide biosynthesis protein [Oscillospiraceae bacterium]|jgi:stage V sporulation protein B|nr:polysaccharide biosynthesis protein [Oscillospiraceae bacterium]